MEKYNYAGFSILHGEDDPIDAMLMDRLLIKIGYNGSYYKITTGQELVKYVFDDTNPLPNLIILDIGLPGLDGKEILGALRENNRTLELPILMMSGSSSIRDYQSCISLGANGYIKKTSDHKYFTSICQNFIQGWAQSANQKFF